MCDVILDLLRSGQRATCATITKKYERNPPSKKHIEDNRRNLNSLRQQIRDKRSILLVPVTKEFYDNSYDDGRELDAAEIEIALPLHSPTYGLVLGSQYPKLEVAHYNRHTETNNTKQGRRQEEYELIIRQGIAVAEDLVKPVLKFDQFKHLEVFLRPVALLGTMSESKPIELTE